MKSIYYQGKQRQDGNAMFFVLIGIALFAALTYTVVRTSSTTGKVSMENAQIAAQQIISYAEKINGAVQSVSLQNGCLSSQISFENSKIAGYINPDAPGSKKCHIFDPAGGGVDYEGPPSLALDTAAAAAGAGGTNALVAQYFFTGNTCVDNVGSGPYTACTPSNSELLLIVPWVSSEICSAINQILGNTTPILVDAGGGFDNTKFTGAFTGNYALGAAGMTAYQVGCYKSVGAPPGTGYHFYYTLLAR